MHSLLFPFIGYIYLIGGSVDERFDHVGNRVVTRLHLRKGCLQRTQPLPYPVLRPAVAVSPNAIVVCGGTSNGSPVSYCQAFSSATEKYVELLQLLTLMSIIVERV